MSNKSNKSLLKAGSVYTLCNLIIRGISFFTIPLFIRLLSTEEFGRFNVFISIESALFIFSALAIHASIKNAYYDKKDTFDDYIKNCVYIDFFNSLLLLLVANVIGVFFSNEIDMSFTEINLLVISGFCQALITIYTSRIIMDYQSGDFVIVSLLSVISGIVLSLLFIFTVFSANHYYGRIYGAVSGWLIAAIYILCKIFKTGIAKISFNDWKYGLKISLPIVPHGLSQIALGTSSTVIIKYIKSASQAGIYSFTYTLTLIPQVLFSSIVNVWEPWFFERMSNEEYDKIKMASTYFCRLISLVFILMACVVPEIVKLLATPDYYEAIDISIVALLGCYFSTLYYIPCEIEYYFKKTNYIAFSTLICAIFNISLNILLMHFYSYKIAAYVMLISYMLYFLFHMYATRYICKKWMFEVSKIFIIAALTCVIVAVILVSINYFYIRAILFISILLYSLFKIKEMLELADLIRLRKCSFGKN